ncbi:serine/threonine-protein kinase, partial [Sphaerisporangium corydalis]
MTSGSRNQVIQERYRLLRPLGAGGMGTVWLADDELLRRRVAIKELVLSPGGEDPSVRRRRMLVEARAAARIAHPGIVPIYDVLVDADPPWIVMAYVQGRTLADLIEDGPLDEGELARIGRRVLGALTAAHTADVLHRDVKPANIVIGEAGKVFLVDFGIAQIGGQSDLTAHNTLPGTLEFMAPERINGHRLGPPSDLWSLGVTLFWALEGRSPFRRSTPVATMRAVTDALLPPITRPGRLANAITGLLRKDPSHRLTPQDLTPL